MELEITIKVPLGAAGVSVEQSTAGAAAPAEEAVQWPPSPADFGLSTALSAAELAPPPLEMVEQLAARAATTNGPPGLEEVSIDEVVVGAEKGLAEPPDLPDISDMPSAADEFAPPPVDDIEPTRSRRRSGQGA